MTSRIISLLIGYALGNFMTAEVVTRKITGKPCKELGTTGNPGMANVMAHLGFKPGITVLAGDLGKTLLSMLIAWILFGMSRGSGNICGMEAIGKLAILYAGLGATLGHNFPVWMKFNGGKGVACTNITLFVFAPVWGLIANAFGMFVVFGSQYLSIGAFCIPAFWAVAMWLTNGPEAGIIGLIFTALMVFRNLKAYGEIARGEGERVDVLGAIKNKFFSK